MVFTLRHGGHVGAHLQKNLIELLLLCAPTWPSWPLSFESHRTERHVSEYYLYIQVYITDVSTSSPGPSPLSNGEIGMETSGHGCQNTPRILEFYVA